MKILLKLETVLTFPFFFLAWMLCGIYYAIRAGHDLASTSGERKAEILAAIFGEKK